MLLNIDGPLTVFNNIAYDIVYATIVFVIVGIFVWMFRQL